MAVPGKALHQLNCHSQRPPKLLNQQDIHTYLEEIPEWKYSPGSKSISRLFSFKDYYETVSFINAAAWIAQQQDHHPEITFSYNKCTVTYTTHSAKGVTLFDLICAAMTSQLLINE